MDKLERFLELHGVAPEYYNYSGKLTAVDVEDRKHLLASTGLSFADDQSLARHLSDLEAAPWQQWLAPVCVVIVGVRDYFVIRLHSDWLQTEFKWFVETEQGEHLSGSFVPGQRPEIESVTFAENQFSARRIDVGHLPTGYHQLVVVCGEDQERTGLIVAPDTCQHDDGSHIWGFTCQLYTLRSSRNWGIGDFSDLLSLIQKSAGLGAGMIGINPLHAPMCFSREGISPYSPSDRLRLNPIYIDPELESDFCDDDLLRGRRENPDWQQKLQNLRDQPLVDYPAVSVLKYEVFVEMYRYFRLHHLDAGSDRAREFIRFVEREGVALKQFAEFEAARAADWGLPTEPDFHLYLQWLADRQLAGCQRQAEAHSMKIGIMRDLAVGADRCGAEIKTNADLFAGGVSFGAPADPLGPLGQNWGMPPPDPLALQADGYRHFIGLLRANMGHCGALRIDHVMALMRLWWCAPDRDSSHGAYVYYPFEDLLAILCLESQRNQCIIVGEDLGVVPDKFRAALKRAGVLSNRVFYFEHYDLWHFKLPADHEPGAIFMVTNHDVPTLAGWWNRSDLDLRQQLGLIESEKALQEGISHREGQKLEVLNWLEQQELLPVNFADKDIQQPLDFGLLEAWLRACARSRSRLLVMQLEDIEMLEEPVNIPGTSMEYPNWRRKLRSDLEDLFNNNKTAELLRSVNAERPH